MNNTCQPMTLATSKVIQKSVVISCNCNLYMHMTLLLTDRSTAHMTLLHCSHDTTAHSHDATARSHDTTAHSHVTTARSHNKDSSPVVLVVSVL